MSKTSKNKESQRAEVTMRAYRSGNQTTEDGDLKSRSGARCSAASLLTPDTCSSHPFQRALFPRPDIPHDQDRQEHNYLGDAEPAQRAVLHCPGKQEDGFHIEDHEQNGDDVEAHGVAAA